MITARPPVASAAARPDPDSGTESYPMPNDAAPRFMPGHGSACMTGTARHGSARIRPALPGTALSASAQRRRTATPAAAGKVLCASAQRRPARLRPRSLSATRHRWHGLTSSTRHRTQHGFLRIRSVSPSTDIRASAQRRRARPVPQLPTDMATHLPALPNPRLHCVHGKALPLAT
jgi:hypothetical protein